MMRPHARAVSTYAEITVEISPPCETTATDWPGWLPTISRSACANASRRPLILGVAPGALLCPNAHLKRAATELAHCLNALAAAAAEEGTPLLTALAHRIRFAEALEWPQLPLAQPPVRAHLQRARLTARAVARDRARGRRCAQKV